MSISRDEKLDLKKLLDQSECDDNTELITKLKHSNLIANDINIFKKIKTESLENEIDVEQCKRECFFLYTYYTDIFNKLVKDEMDLTLLTKFLVVLKMIEDGKVDQHEGSVIVGKILKEIYVDSALKLSDNLDKKYANDSTTPVKVEGVKLSWKEFKEIQRNK